MTWREIRYKIEEGIKSNNIDYEIVRSFFTYIEENPLSDEDIPLIISLFKNKTYYLSSFKFTGSSSNLVENFYKLFKNQEFYELCLKNTHLIRNYLNFVTDKKERERVLIDVFKRYPNAPYVELTLEEAKKFDYFPEDLYHVWKFFDRFKEDPDFILVSLKKLIDRNQHKRRFINRNSVEIAKVFSYFPESHIHKLYELVKDTKYIVFLLANKHATQEMKKKALILQSKIFLKFPFATRIEKEELLSLTPTQLWNFLSKVMRNVDSFSKKSELIEIAPIDVEELKVRLFSFIRREDFNSFFRKYETYSNILKNEESWILKAEKAFEKLSPLSQEVEKSLSTFSKNDYETFIKYLLKFGVVYFIPTRATEREAEEIVKFLERVLGKDFIK